MPNHPENPETTTAAESVVAQTTIGSIEGFIDPSFPRVRQWLGVPFAEPPIGDRRFAPPERKKAFAKGEILSATRMPPAPMQAHTTKPDFYAKYVPEFLARGPYSEDCLYLNVFAPREKTTQSPFPTLVFFYGGEGEWGGINAEYMQPHSWVERSQKHIVVLFNWRVGIFGFPNAKGLRHGPIGILDQRLALEFLRDNIGAFGGSPSNITAFGHAGGAVSIEAHLFAWPEDPIVSAAICISGHLPMIKAHRDLTKESFSLIARRLGCPQHATPEEEVAFLRGADAGAILGCFRAYKDSDAEPQLLFRPQTDDVFIFTPEEQLERARKGQFAKVPMLLGMTADEGNALVHPTELAAGKDGATAAAANWTRVFEDTLQQVLEYRVANGCTSFKCFYAGDFPNVSPRPWMKAYHFAELPMLMGTHEIERGPSTEFQRQLSEIMQDMWVDFARDPEKGLARWGWEAASRGCFSAMVLGKDGILFQQENKSPRDHALISGKETPQQSG